MDRQQLQNNLAAVEQRIRAACQRAGRARGEVTLVAVTKTVAVEVAAALVELGVHDLGENRPQELWRKAEALGSFSTQVSWHLIGHLQRNKVERTLPLVKLFHSVDSLRLLDELDLQGKKLGRPVDVLLEVNVSGEGSKQGFTPTAVAAAVDSLREIKGVHVRGLMTMAPLQDPEACRPLFAKLCGLRDTLAKELAPHHQVEHLSMGMSNDFEVAIEEGATLVRLGTVLFDETDSTGAV